MNMGLFDGSLFKCAGLFHGNLFMNTGLFSWIRISFHEYVSLWWVPFQMCRTVSWKSFHEYGSLFMNTGLFDGSLFKCAGLFHGNLFICSLGVGKEIDVSFIEIFGHFKVSFMGLFSWIQVSFHLLSWRRKRNWRVFYWDLLTLWGLFYGSLLQKRPILLQKERPIKEIDVSFIEICGYFEVSFMGLFSCALLASAMLLGNQHPASPDPSFLISLFSFMRVFVVGLFS